MTKRRRKRRRRKRFMMLSNIDDGRFEVKEKLDEGLFMTVYNGTDHTTGQRVLVQVTSKKELVDNAKAWSKAAQECGEAEHVLATGQLEGSRCYVISEFPIDQSCLSLGKVEEFSNYMSISFARQLCDIVAYLHRNGYVHKEIDPGSVLVTIDDIPMVRVLRKPNLNNVFGYPLRDNVWQERNASDVESGLKTLYQDGLYYYVPGKICDILAAQQKQSLEGWMYATLNPFIAPECAVGKGDQRADVYSIGAILYWMVMYAHPFDVESLMVTLADGRLLPQDVKGDLLLHKILEEMYKEKLYGVFEEEDLPLELRDIIYRATSGLVEERFQSVEELVEAMERVDWKSLEVIVMNPSREPLPDIPVTIRRKAINYRIPDERHTGSTDHKGCFRVDGLLSGTCEVVIRGNKSYQPYKQQVELSESTKLEVVLESRSLWEKIKRW